MFASVRTELRKPNRLGGIYSQNRPNKALVFFFTVSISSAQTLTRKFQRRACGERSQSRIFVLYMNRRVIRAQPTTDSCVNFLKSILILLPTCPIACMTY